MKFKVGDTVKIVDKGKIHSTYSSLFDCEELIKFKTNFTSFGYADINKKYIVVANTKHKTEETNLCIIQDNDTKQVYIYNEIGLELAKFKVSDINSGDRITFKDCEVEVATKLGSDLVTDIYYIDEELFDTDILKVERPTSYETIYVKNETKEMTLKEICDKLGYEVKIVKENK